MLRDSVAALAINPSTSNLLAGQCYFVLCVCDRAWEPLCLAVSVEERKNVRSLETTEAVKSQIWMDETSIQLSLTSNYLCLYFSLCDLTLFQQPLTDVNIKKLTSLKSILPAHLLKRSRCILKHHYVTDLHWCPCMFMFMQSFAMKLWNGYSSFFSKDFFLADYSCFFFWENVSFEFHVHKNVIIRCSSCYKHVIIYYLEKSELLSLNHANLGQKQRNYKFLTKII